MKKLGLYLVVTLALFSVLSGFLNPEKSFAQTNQENTNTNENTQNKIPPVTKANINTIISKGNETIDSIEISYSLGLKAESQILTAAKAKYDKSTYKDELSLLANNVLKNNPTISAAEAELLIFDQFLSYLYKQNTPMSIAAIPKIGPLRASAATAFKVQKGELTNDDAKTENEQTSARWQGVETLTQGDLAGGKGKCTSIANASIVDCIDISVSWIIKNTLLQIAGFLVWASANMLNLSIQYGILGFSSWAPNTLYPIWIIVRQIVSLFIVFAGLYLGFMYIIGRDDKFKQYIPWVILFALFVNFSYPLTRALTDVSNVISLNIYSSAVGNDALTSNDPNNTAGALIMERLGLQKLVLSATAVGKDGVGFVENINSVPGALVAVAYVGYAAYIFFMATGIIAFRTAYLVFLIIASPILFIDSVIPKLGELAAKLRKIFFEQLIVAPVFMIMLALTLKFLEVFKAGPASMTGINSAVGLPSITVFFNILMMLIMLHIMLKVTKSVGGSVGQMATETMGKVGGFAMGAASGGAGLLARGTLGRAAAAARNSSWVTNNQDSVLGRHAYNMTNSLANSTWDARNSGVVSKKMSAIGMGMGAGGKMGYDQENKSRLEDANTRRDRIKTTNADGTINKEGAEAKQRMNDYAGGIFANKKEVRKSFMEKDFAEAEKQDDKLKSYDKLSDEKRQNYLRSEKDQAMKQQLIDHDLAKSESVNKKVDQYNKLSNKSKQIYYASQNDEVKGVMQNIDNNKAMEINDKIDKVDEINLASYKSMTNSDKQQYYAKQPEYLQQNMNSQDMTEAKEMNAFHERMISRKNKTKTQNDTAATSTPPTPPTTASSPATTGNIPKLAFIPPTAHTANQNQQPATGTTG